MKEDSNHKFYLVREDILPEAIKKTIKVKEILKHHQTRTINEAVRMMDLSRSAYYKYKTMSSFVRCYAGKSLPCRS